MNNYLLKWTCNDKVAYKTGISKDHTQLLENRFGKSSKFYHPGYSLFKIEELAHVYCSSESYSLARAAAFGMEHAFKAVFPKYSIVSFSETCFIFLIELKRIFSA